MSLLKTIKAQLGLSGTPANNFTLDASADNGTMKLARGNAGATTQDIMVVAADGKVTFPQNAPAGALRQVEQVTASGNTVNFTIPSWAKRITVASKNISTTGAPPYIQLGVGTVSVTGYSAQAGAANASGGVVTTGFPLCHLSAGANVFGGTSVFDLLPDGSWVMSSLLAFLAGSSPPAISGGYSPIFGSPIDILGYGCGAATFDSGSITVICEG